MPTRKPNPSLVLSKPDLLQHLKQQPPDELLRLLSAAYDVLDDPRRQAVFGQHLHPEPVSLAGDNQALLGAIQAFQQRLVRPAGAVSTGQRATDASRPARRGGGVFLDSI